MVFYSYPLLQVKLREVKLFVQRHTAPEWGAGIQILEETESYGHCAISSDFWNRHGEGQEVGGGW